MNGVADVNEKEDISLFPSYKIVCVVSYNTLFFALSRKLS